MSLAIELPENLSEQIEARQIPDQKVKAVAIAALEIWLAQQPPLRPEEPFTSDAFAFTRKLIANNRELFEALAQR